MPTKKQQSNTDKSQVSIAVTDKVDGGPDQSLGQNLINSEKCPFMKKIDALMKIGLNKDVSLPKIILVGDQSSGKSSTFEAISGLDFMPKGEGVATRCPTVFEMENDLEVRTHIKFSDYPELSFYEEDKLEVAEMLEQIQNEKAGSNKGIVDEPIHIKVFSPLCPNLTIVDLPGIVRVRKNNSDQPENIGEITEKLALNYASEENTIIVVVHRADIDIENSAGVMIAKRADPEQIRTIGVLTRMDDPKSKEKGISMLEGDDLPLKLGWVGLKNRSSEDIKNGVTIQEARDNEIQFFKLTQPFSAKIQDRPYLFGVVSLCNKLIPLLNDICKQSYPIISDKIYNQLKESEGSMKKLGHAPPQSDEQKRIFLIKINEQFSRLMRQCIEGNLNDEIHDIKEGGHSLKKIYLSLYQDRLCYYESPKVQHSPVINKALAGNQVTGTGLFGGTPASAGNQFTGQNFFGHKQASAPVAPSNNVPITSEDYRWNLFFKKTQAETALSDETLKAMHQKFAGHNLSVFMPNNVFNFCVKILLRRIEEEPELLIKNVQAVLISLAEQVLTKIIPNMQDLNAEYLRVFKTLLNDRIKQCSEIIEQLIEAEKTFQYLHDEEDLLKSYREKVEKNEKKLSFMKEEYIVLARHVICQYYEKSLLGLRNSIPKQVGYQMVEKTLMFMNDVLTEKLELLAIQVAEPIHAVAERDRLRSKIDRLKLAKDELERP